ncbi:hypothetical protein DKT74_37260 [Streptomyces sp. ZEA17I]|uniref:hypothetical protein n=1 Tax=Streptomyces sp. ZEA17I TaxID=2202516 RepID=UPI000D6F25A1|nr:hypothetical protein [Streptomyces sp. ZEA17I]PWS39646.1 hypothetical protein DKT74_37260 [Streptomyces sp. ZEA17I]
MQVTTRERIHPWQIGLAVCAVVTPLVPVIASGESFFVLPLVVATAALAAVPLFFYARPSAFRPAAGIVSAVLLPWSLIGSWFGMLVFFPSVPLLVLSVFSDPRRYPGAARFLAGAGFLLAVAVTLFWWGRGW